MSDFFLDLQASFPRLVFSTASLEILQALHVTKSLKNYNDCKWLDADHNLLRVTAYHPC